eukprot:TRINITY_DN4621_c0_g1_i12.p6 TRINITY_DN4621_c0_g1~~TRINITY_DN4621_c0_g1_i12.p6  ORF type:complete len:114 (+),score=1.11 TRINITY_DN4621_c0_g1_i12:1567-1908(+)
MIMLFMVFLRTRIFLNQPAYKSKFQAYQNSQPWLLKYVNLFGWSVVFKLYFGGGESQFFGRVYLKLKKKSQGGERILLLLQYSKRYQLGIGGRVQCSYMYRWFSLQLIFQLFH